MKTIRIFITSAAALFVFSAAANAQGFYSMGSGSYMTGYGQVHGSFGYAMATQNMYNTMQMNMQKSMMRAAMIKKWGRAKVEEAERNASRSSGSSRPSTVASPRIVVEPRPVPKNYGKFRPGPTVDTAKTIADAVGETPEEKELIRRVVNGTKAAFEKETAAKGWNNNLAGAFTFFIVATSTIYHDAPDPDAETTAAVYDAVSLSIDEIPDFRAIPNKDKQALYNMLIGFAGIPLATYSEGKGNGSAETVKVARELAGKMIELVLKTDPDKVRFDSRSLTN